MQYVIIILSIFLIVFMVSAIYYMNISNKQKKQIEENEEPINGNVIYPYKLTQCIFSQKERYFYRDVKPIADKLGLIVFTKIRLADLLIIDKNQQDFNKWFNRIKAKHIDFIFVDNDYRIKMLVEIDDVTHNRPDRQARDDEVNEMFRQQGIEILHIKTWGQRYGAEELETIITKALDIKNN